MELGIYIHIPFCKRKCLYCSFYSIEKMELLQPYFAALIHEIELKLKYIANPVIKTIYIGGGTPSVCSAKDIEKILDIIKFYSKVLDNVEITMEVNPGAANKKYLNDILKIGVNRLSIGIQSFVDAELEFLGRIHSAKEAEDILKNAKEVGFKNISVDFINGISGQDMAEYKKSLDLAIALGSTHVSTYSLSIEEGTPFGNRGIVQDENVQAEFIELTAAHLVENGFIHYEISNYAKEEKFFSKHNMGYWQGQPYLGFGASAHSYIGEKRWWNDADVSDYIKSDGVPNQGCEIISEAKREQEEIFLGLRTCFGVKKELLKNKNLEPYITAGFAQIKDNRFVLTEKGFLVYDEIASEIM